ncbi:DUF1566 domain-containing protein [Porticoccaceae bacterium]|nr:DUF1566 domain-containing protein [Porticoccaceae bacterium]MDA8663453.1 DUF1566 domain-containing protein [Porticoccaceae bacterium]MDA8682285.1 DUF1566 domain-containing protein [Porticoccaceae bacterium]MDB2343813.1 DUF1566 domain-containing protein [Porticoccaceae bacterium]
MRQIFLELMWLLKGRFSSLFQGNASVFFAFLMFVVLTGCDRYTEKPSCKSVIDENDMGTFSLTEPTGAVLNWRTNTTWYRCPAGSFSNGEGCKGEPIKLAWGDAKNYAEEFSAMSGINWRLPTLAEMDTLILRDCVSPAINLNVFPTLKSSNFWSSDQSDRQTNSFACSINTRNGANHCKQLTKSKLSFLLVLQTPPNSAADKITDQDADAGT